MNGNRFFSVPFDNRNDVTIRLLRYAGGYAAYGRWVALLGMLYDADGVLDMNNQAVNKLVCADLELDDAGEFLNMLVELGLIDREAYCKRNHIANRGVCDELAYKHKKSEAGKKGMAKRYGTTDD